MSDTFFCPRRVADGVSLGTDFWRHEVDGIRTCSYDGSLHPEDFLAYVKAGSQIEPTDKSYKIYVRAADDKVKGAGKFYTHHFSLNLAWGDEFAALYESKAITWGYPGYNYVALYVPRTPTSEQQEKQ